MSAVYRMFDVHSKLLYVGYSANPTSRFAAHERKSDWWREVAWITVEHHESRDVALDVEAAAISAEHPLYNVRRPGRVRPQLTVEEREARRASTHYSNTAVRCVNCGHVPELLPKGLNVMKIKCDRCRCRALTARLPVRADEPSAA